MNYIESLNFINSFAMFGTKSSMKQFMELLYALKNPHQQLKFIHIAGTNGKGSTSTMISNILINAGIKTGLYISPYVIEFRERIQIDGKMISESGLCDCIKQVKECIQNLKYNAYSYFEIVTAVALLWYHKQQCDVVVLEVGLGGRLDATNVIECPLVQVITSIGLDHTHILGDDILQIATEKAGIIKGATTVIYPIQEAGVLELISSICHKKNSKIVIPDLQALNILDTSFRAKEFIYKTLRFNKSLLGQFQIYNAICAIEVALNLKEYFNITDEDIISGINNTFFPARLEVVNEAPLIILDGAHNPSGIKALNKAISNFKQLIIIIGVLEDKDYISMLKYIVPRGTCIIAVTPNHKQAMPAHKLKQLINHNNVTAYNNPKDAIEYALTIAKKNDTIIICGSLYLVSEMRKFFSSPL
ncbi:MAG: hypothetical protein BEN19_02130 [Epulopiscium sp. Nuni2H_MBin003]|nr:MAG: hypothetical protein BEN19_02130 [Epulopiscium sp. Nuni2H_MBin003]